MHPNDRYERRLINQKKNARRKHMKQNDAIISTVEGGVAFEMKTMPNTITCEVCGDTMEFVSIETGYSCLNEDCILHFGYVEKELKDEQT